MTLVTISAPYGCGGSRIAPALAERLGVPLLGRPPAPDLDPEVEEPSGRLLSRVASLALAWGTPGGMGLDELLPDSTGRDQIEREIRELAASGEGVILGRGAALLLREDPRVLRARLDGPPEARLRQAMAFQDLDEDTARHALRTTDQAHAEYARRFYGADLGDAALYHVVLDTTAIDLDDAVEILAAAARSLAASPRGAYAD
jgi:cytidylate kinase